MRALSEELESKDTAFLWHAGMHEHGLPGNSRQRLNCGGNSLCAECAHIAVFWMHLLASAAGSGVNQVRVQKSGGNRANSAGYWR